MTPSILQDIVGSASKVLHVQSSRLSKLAGSTACPKENPSTFIVDVTSSFCWWTSCRFQQVGQTLSFKSTLWDVSKQLESSQKYWSHPCDWRGLLFYQRVSYRSRSRLIVGIHSNQGRWSFPEVVPNKFKSFKSPVTLCRPPSTTQRFLNCRGCLWTWLWPFSGATNVPWRRSTQDQANSYQLFFVNRYIWHIIPKDRTQGDQNEYQNIINMIYIMIMRLWNEGAGQFSCTGFQVGMDRCNLSFLDGLAIWVPNRRLACGFGNLGVANKLMLFSYIQYLKI